MSKVIVQGNAQGKVLKSTNPINFLGAVDKKTGIIRDKKYDIFEKSMKATVLVFPHELEVVLVHTQFILLNLINLHLLQ